jgi:hypothetical protein
LMSLTFVVETASLYEMAHTSACLDWIHATNNYQVTQNFEVFNLLHIVFILLERLYLSEIYSCVQLPEINSTVDVTRIIKHSGVFASIIIQVSHVTRNPHTSMRQLCSAL